MYYMILIIYNVFILKLLLELLLFYQLELHQKLTPTPRGVSRIHSKYFPHSKMKWGPPPNDR